MTFTRKALKLLKEALPDLLTQAPNLAARRAIGASIASHPVALAKVSPDGGLVRGIPGPRMGAKYALRNGLPEKPGEGRLAVVNPPHQADDFDGVIESGYGAGEKRLLYTGVGVLDNGKDFKLTKLNYHIHHADRAGTHFDLVVEAARPWAANYKFFIPNGPWKGEYAVRRTVFGEVKKVWNLPGPAWIKRSEPLYIDFGVRRLRFAQRIEWARFPYLAIVKLEDPGLVLEKPKVKLTTLEELDKKGISHENAVFEHKYDGSLANVHVIGDRAYFRSHRDGGETYIGRLPKLERIPGWEKELILKGELVHPDGAAKTSGILNSLPDRAFAAQARKPVEIWLWDVVQVGGRNVEHLPYSQRRIILEQVGAKLSRRNPHWHVIPRVNESWDETISKPLPWGEGWVIKTDDQWYKVKWFEPLDVEIVDIIPGTGKYAGSAGAILVRDPETAEIGEVGSLAVNDAQRQWLWDNRDQVRGQVAMVKAMAKTDRGVPRAGVFIGLHPDKSGIAMPVEL